jgi:5'(3')-deoxyribonucleotidase
MIILLDMDNVLADWTARVLEIFNDGVWEQINAKKLERPFVLSDVRDFKMTLTLGPGSAQAIDAIMSSEQFWADLMPIDGALAGVDDLMHMGHEIVICTMLPFFKSARAPAYDGKISWLEKNMPNRFNIDKNFMAVGRKDLVKGHILLDDGMHNIDAFATTGNEPVVFARPWNFMAPTTYHRVGSWREFVDGVANNLFVSDWRAQREPR